MTIQELAPYFEAYPAAVKKAKDEQGHTIQSLVDASGVSYSAVSKLLSGAQQNPTLYNAAALCEVLGLSLDELMGLRPPEEPTGEQQRQIYELSSENSVLQSTVEHYKALSAVYKPLIFGLLGVCALLLCAVIGYIVFDIRMTQVGLFQSAGMSVLAVLLAVVVIAAISLMAYTAKMIIKNAKSPRN